MTTSRKLDDTTFAVQSTFCSDICLALAVRIAIAPLTALLTPPAALIPVVIVTSILFLALLGGFGTRAREAHVVKAAVRVTFWGALAMGLTAGVGALFGAAV